MMDIRGAYAALDMIPCVGRKEVEDLDSKIRLYWEELGLEVSRNEAFDPEFLKRLQSRGVP